MEGAKVSRYAFIAALVFLLYLVSMMVLPFFTYIITGLILVVASYPVYKWLSKNLKSKKVSSFITIILILLLLVIPFSLLIGSLALQTKSFVESFDIASFEKASEYFNKVNSYVVKALGPGADLKGNIDSILQSIEKFVIDSSASILNSIADAVLGLFVMFFIMYFGFVEGNKWSSGIKQVIPMSKDRKEKLISGVKDVTHAVIYGQILIALLEGILGGVGFLIVGIHNPVFWGFIMTVLAFIPVVGAGLIWVPAGIIEIINNNVLGGIFILVYCFFIFTVIDNLLKPRIISGKGKIHPIVGLIGVLGGLKLFGFLGIIIGPIIAALFITMAEFFYEDYVKEK